MPSIALERRLAGTDVLPLKGTLAAPLPEHVRVAVLAALGEHGATPPSRGLTVLREAIARSLPAPADPEREILVTNGAMHALSLTFRALLEPGDEVIVPTPCYFFAGLIERAGGVFVPVPSWDPDGDRASGDAEVAGSRPDEPEQSRRPPPVAEPRSTSSSRSPSRHEPDGDHRRGVRALHPRGRARLRLGRAERDPDPQPRQEPRDAGVADRLRRRPSRR